MFDDPKVAAVFAEYAARDAAEQAQIRADGPNAFANRDQLLLPVGVDVGRFLHALILARKPRRILELGTSYGYSTLFLTDAARAVGGQVVTMDLADYKQDHARDALERAGLAAHVEFRLGDAVELVAADPGTFDFALLDIWKDLYLPCFEALYPKLDEQGIVASDNMTYPESARPEVRKFRAAVSARADLTSTLLPIGNGLELTVKWSPGNPNL